MKKILAIVLASALLLTGCTSGSAENSENQIYYISQDGKGVYSTVYTTDSGSSDWITEMKDALNEGKNVPSECLSLKSYGVSISDATLSGNILSVNFSSGFNSLQSKDKLLLIAVTVKTFCQQSSVASVKVLSGGIPLKDDSGNELSAFTLESFLDESNDLLNNFTKTNMKLYFASADGLHLTSETKDVYYSNKTPLAQAVVDALKKGPDEAGSKAVLESGVNVLNVTIQDNFCYVNFDDTFLNQTLDIDPNLQLYAIVNSICAVCNVDRVSFSVNGSSEIMYKDTVDLRQTFSPDETMTED